MEAEEGELAAKRYKAFISYSHADAAMGRWFHKRLENYSVPKSLIGKQTSKGKIPPDLKPVFKDREELAVSHKLSDEISAALEASEHLVILCSPKAAKSEWVNAEILAFKKMHGESRIFPVILSGEPFASDPLKECFPEALKFELGEDGELSDKASEPIAADFRSVGDGRALGLTKVIAGLLGVGLDELVQRDLQRQRQRVTWVTVASISLVLLFAFLALMAWWARQEAEQRRSDAEGLIEFMLTDLKDKLEPVGRLEALESVGQQAVAYYDGYGLNQHDDDALGRRARVFHYLGEIDHKLGHLDIANERFLKAYNATERLLNREPDNPDRVYEHAQSVFWVGFVYWRNGKTEQSEPFMQKYSELADRLQVLEPDNPRSYQEKAYAANNLSGQSAAIGDLENAFAYRKQSLKAAQKLVELMPENKAYQLQLANAYSYLASSAGNVSTLHEAIDYANEGIAVLSSVSNSVPEDISVEKAYLLANANKLRLQLYVGETEMAHKAALQFAARSSEVFSHDQMDKDWLNRHQQHLLIAAQVSLQAGDEQSLENHRQEHAALEHFYSKGEAQSQMRLLDYQLSKAWLLYYDALLKRDRIKVVEALEKASQVAKQQMSEGGFRRRAQLELIQLELLSYVRTADPANLEGAFKQFESLKPFTHPHAKALYSYALKASGDLEAASQMETEVLDTGFSYDSYSFDLLAMTENLFKDEY